MAKSKLKTIDWQKAANDAAEFVSRVLSEAHREVMPWHGPTDTWLAFDTCIYDPPGQYLDVLRDYVDGYVDILAYALFYDPDEIPAAAILFRCESHNDAEFVKEAMWECWRNETDSIIDGMPKAEQKAQRSHRDMQEVIERTNSGNRVTRFVMDRPSNWDKELERVYHRRR